MRRPRAEGPRGPSSRPGRDRDDLAPRVRRVASRVDRRPPEGAPFNRYDWLLFDLDGTLLDYHAAEAAALDATLRDAGLTASDAVRASYRRINADHWARLEAGETTPERLRVDRWAELLADQRHDDVEPRAVADAYITHLAAGAHLVDGALEVLDDLARDHRIAFITNGLADVQRPRLSAAGLLHRAETVVISDEVGVAKPEPAIFDLVLAGMGRPERSRVLMVGDSLTSDIAGGRDAGLDTAWVNPEGGSHDGIAPTYTIGSVRELAGVVRA